MNNFNKLSLLEKEIFCYFWNHKNLSIGEIAAGTGFPEDFVCDTIYRLVILKLISPQDYFNIKDISKTTMQLNKYHLNEIMLELFGPQEHDNEPELTADQFKHINKAAWEKKQPKIPMPDDLFRD